MSTVDAGQAPAVAVLRGGLTRPSSLPCWPCCSPRDQPARQRPWPIRGRRQPGRTALAYCTAGPVPARMPGVLPRCRADSPEEKPHAHKPRHVETPVNAHKTGTVSNLTPQAGTTLASGALICEINSAEAPSN